MSKVLVIRFSSIGDIVLTTPVIRCLKEQLDNQEIHFLTKKPFVPVLASNPFINKIYAIEKSIGEVENQLKQEQYDYIIDLHNNLRSLTVSIKLGKPVFRFNKLNTEKWLLVNFKINKLPDIHIVDRYLETVKDLGIKNDGKGLDYFIPVKDEVNTDSLPPTHRDGYIAFVIGGQHATKLLPEKKIIAVCNKLNRPVVLLGGKEDSETAGKITSLVGSNKIYNACGKYNINQSASLIKQACKVITHDTGLMHIAAAFKKEIVSVWGNTVPAFGMYPYLPGPHSKIIEINELRCRPCSKLGFEKCPKKHFYCMNLIDENEIAEAVNEYKVKS